MAFCELFSCYLQRRGTLSKGDMIRLRGIPTRLVTFGPHEIIIPAGGALKQSCMVTAGMAARLHSQKDRDCQQVITALHVPGDLVAPHTFIVTDLDHQVVSLGKTQIEFIHYDHLATVTRDYPDLMQLLWKSTALEAAIHRQWQVAAAALRSSAHLAHLLCEVYTRLSIVGAARDGKMTLPLLQRDIAGMLGYSAIHINRSVGDLRDQRLVSWQGSDITILDWAELAHFAQFDPSYLDLKRQC